MKKFLFVFALLTLSLSAVELHKAESYEEAQQLAKKEHKHIMVLITQDNCRWCQKMKKTTYKDPKVIERINRSYIFVEVHRYNDEYPKKLTVFGVPTTYFLYNDGTKIMQGVGGYWSSEDFMSFMDDADYKINKGRN